MQKFDLKGIIKENNEGKKNGYLISPDDVIKKIESGELPKILYKYRSWSDNYHKKFLLENELYLSSPSDFNDPFDCRITPDIKLLSSDELINKYITQEIDNAEQDEKHTEQQKMLAAEKMRNRIMYNPTGAQDELDELTFKMQDEHYGIASFSKIWDNILMWSYYADHHRGFCVGLNHTELLKLEKIGFGGDIIYSKSFPRNSPIEELELAVLRTMMETTRYKYFDWAHEKEFRLRANFFSKVPTIEERIVKFPDTCFAEVILGINFPKSDKEKLVSLLKSKNVSVYQAKKVSYEFKIEKHLL